MANENFTTYTEVDPSGHMTETATRATSVAMQKPETCYLYKDKGAGHFSGDFEFLFEGKVETSSVDDAHIFICSMADALDGIEGCDGIGVMVYSYGSNQDFGVA